MKTIIAAACLTAIAFTAVKLSTSAGDAYRVGLALLQWPFRAAHALFHGGRLPSVGRAQLAADPTDNRPRFRHKTKNWPCCQTSG